MGTARSSNLLGKITVLVVICFCSLPVHAKYGGGTGEPNNPYLIYSAEQLNEIGISKYDLDAHFKLMADIDLNDLGEDQFNIIGYIPLSPVPVEPPFSGVFDGNGHSISNLRIESTDSYYAGLFGNVSGLSVIIKNLVIIDPNIQVQKPYVGSLIGKMLEGKIENCHIYNPRVSGSRNTGGLVGSLWKSSIANCSVTEGHITGTDAIGGLIGGLSYTVVSHCQSTAEVLAVEDEAGGLTGLSMHGTYFDCHSTGTVTGVEEVGGLVGSCWDDLISGCSSSSDVMGEIYVGGLVGRCLYITRISGSIAAGEVSGVSNIGGLVGGFGTSIGFIRDSYAYGRVIGENTSTGGLVGNLYGYISNCYSTGEVSEEAGGLVGELISGDVEDSFWDTESSGTLDSDGGIGMTTLQMQSMSTFTNAGWDFTHETDNGISNVWAEPSEVGYPILWWQLDTLPELPEFSGGSGTLSEPYLISNVLELNSISDNPLLMTRHYRLVNDIDLETAEFYCIGTEFYPFTGTFDGNNMQILNYHCSGSDNNSVGLFGCMRESESAIRNLIVVDPNVDVSSGKYVGSLLGRLVLGKVECCHVKGGSVRGGVDVGGLIGYSSGTVSKCSSFSTKVEGLYAGGLIGYIVYRSSLTESCSRDRIVEQGGGLVGYNSGHISNCYAENLYGNCWTAGLVGTNSHNGTISNCYAAMSLPPECDYGGMVGTNYSDDVFEYCFWDAEVSGIPDDLVENMTTEQMMTARTFLDWTCQNVWKIDDGHDYPRLAWEDTTGSLLNHQWYAGGTGTVEDPYLITTAEQLNTIALVLCDLDKNFKLIADIDMGHLSGSEFNLIGTGVDRFRGVFDGNNHIISNFTYSAPSSSFGGLFGIVDSPDSEIRDLWLVDPNVRGEDRSVGALVAYLNNGSIKRCRVYGGTIRGYRDVGALVGRIDYYNAKILDCYASSTVEGTENVGGLAGSSRGEIACSVAESAVTGNTYVGGFVGENQSVIVNCYSSGDVEGTRYVGGFAGKSYGGIKKCYCTGRVSAESDAGGFVAAGTSTSGMCFWDVNTTGQSHSVVGTGLTTVEMMSAITYCGWGRGPVWNINEGVDYPHLIWEQYPGELITVSLIFPEGDGNELNPYLVSTVEQLCLIGLMEDEWGECFRLMSDIDLSDYLQRRFSMIGTDSRWFTGTFDGNGHTISNLEMHLTGDRVGMFGKSRDAVIRNLGLIDPNIDALDSDYVGLLAGHLENGLVENCWCESGHIAGHNYVGSLVGYLKYGRIENCWCENGHISGYGSVGSLVGYLWYGLVENCWCENGHISGDDDIGGLIGHSNSSRIVDCRATVTVVGRDTAGGIAGRSTKGTIQSCQSENIVVGDYFTGGLVGRNYDANVVTCFATGAVDGNFATGGLLGLNSGSVRECWSDTCVFGDNYTGGLIGNNSGDIRRCVSRGIVTGNSIVGGLVGRNNTSKIVNCYSVADVNGQSEIGGLVGENEWGFVANCYAAGLLATTDGNYVGAMLGKNSGSVVSSYWDLNTVGFDRSAGGLGRTTEQMKQAETFVSWGCDGSWSIDDGNDYPQLIWENKPEQLIPAPTFGGGAGVADDPYLIFSAEQLNLVGLAWCYWDRYFKLMGDIDMASLANNQINPIGVAHYPFAGIFDGNDCTISNFTCDSNDRSQIGLFGRVDDPNAEIKNLGLVDPNVDAGTRDYVGSLVGFLRKGTIKDCNVWNCYISGQENVGGMVGYSAGNIYGCEVVGRVSGSRAVGALVAYNVGTISYSSATGDIQGERWIGGLVGQNNAQISYSRADVTVTGTDDIGGLVGCFRYGNISNCCATGTVTAIDSVAGGLVGRNFYGTVKHSYASGPVNGGFVVGGLVGYDSLGVYTSSFWDINVNPLLTGIGNTDDPNVIGESTANMQTESTFTDAGWDFITPIWKMNCEGMSYPKLSWWQPMPGDFGCPDGVNFFDFSFFASRWAEDNCAVTNDCDGRDLDLLGSVDIKDLIIFVDNWLAGF